MSSLSPLPRAIQVKAQRAASDRGGLHRVGIFSAALAVTALALYSAMTGQAAHAQNSASSPELAPNAPKSYTVKSGDTLWGIATLFLRDPWLWPEIWYVNPQVENPHLIYPGDVLTLGYGADGRPQLTLERGGGTRLSPRVRSRPLDEAITAIPYEAVAAFMSKPTVLEKAQIKAAPHVVSSRDQHLATATGNTIYAAKLDGEVGSRYSVMHVGDALRDPDNKEVVGYQGIFTADAKVTRTGEPATLMITEAHRETFNGDVLFPADAEVQLDFIPHAPQNEIDGRIMALPNAILMVGQYQAVVINRGKQHGLEPGHVLSILQVGPTIRDRTNSMDTTKFDRAFGPKMKLPDEPSGKLMVFKTFDRVSYGLVLESTAPIRELDRVVNP